MLKIWQQAWSKKPAQESEQSTGQGGGHDFQLNDHIAESSSATNTARTPSADPESASPTAFPPTLRHKRDSASLGPTSLSRLAKKPRTKHDLDPSVSTEAPQELVVFHERLDQLPLTPLYRKLHEADPQEQYLRRYFSASRHVLVEVGSCASELVWRRAANDIEASIVELDEDQEPDPEAPQTKERLAKLEVLNTIKHWDFSMPNLDASSRGFNVTPKFLKLAQIIKSCQPYREDFRGIVFGRLNTRHATFVMLTCHSAQKGCGSRDGRPHTHYRRTRFHPPTAARWAKHAWRSRGAGTHSIINSLCTTHLTIFR